MANIIRVSGGTGKGIGTASAADVLAGKTFTNSQGTDTGTMPDRGAWTGTVDGGTSITIPEGYHNGSGKVSSNASSGPGYPIEYKFKNGVYASGESLTIPDNIIPITLKIEGGTVWGASSVLDVANTIKTNLGDLYTVTVEGRANTLLPTLFISIAGYYSFDYEIMKGINSISQTVGMTAGEGGTPSTITLVEWLEAE